MQADGMYPWRYKKSVLSSGQGKTIPRACLKTIMASVNPIADGGSVFQRDRSFIFDREIRDTTAGVELIGASDSPGRARVDAAIARSAVVSCGRVRLD